MGALGMLGILFVAAAADGIVEQFGWLALVGAVAVFGWMALKGEKA